MSGNQELPPSGPNDRTDRKGFVYLPRIKESALDKDIQKVVDEGVRVAQLIVRRIGFVVSDADTEIVKSRVQSASGDILQDAQKVHLPGLSLVIERLGITFFYHHFMESFASSPWSCLTKPQRVKIDDEVCSALRIANNPDGTGGYDPRCWSLPRVGETIRALNLTPAENHRTAVRTWILDCLTSLMEIQDQKLYARSVPAELLKRGFTKMRQSTERYLAEKRERSRKH